MGRSGRGAYMKQYPGDGKVREGGIHVAVSRRWEGQGGGRTFNTIQVIGRSGSGAYFHT